jgi:uncharacterized protein YpuA (DUF1002 family)
MKNIIMENHSKNENVNNIVEFVNNLNLKEEDFKKIYDKLEKILSKKPERKKNMEEIIETSTSGDKEGKEKAVLSELLTRIDSQELYQIFQDENFNDFLQEFLLRKML